MVRFLFCFSEFKEKTKFNTESCRSLLTMMDVSFVDTRLVFRGWLFIEYDVITQGRINKQTKTNKHTQIKADCDDDRSQTDLVPVVRILTPLSLFHS